MIKKKVVLVSDPPRTQNSDFVASCLWLKYNLKNEETLNIASLDTGSGSGMTTSFYLGAILSHGFPVNTKPLRVS